MKVFQYFIFLLIVLIYSCSEKVDENIAIYGEKNTVTVNFPDGKKVYNVDLAKNTFNSDIYQSVHFFYQNYSQLYIRNLTNSYYINMGASSYPFPVGEVTNNSLNVEGSMQFFYNGAFYFSNFTNDNDFILFDVLELGNELVHNSGGGTYGIIEELEEVKGSFSALTKDCKSGSTCEEMGVITGTFYITK